MKKLVSFVLVLALLCSLMAGTALAASTDYALTGGTATVNGTADQTVEVKFTSIAGGSYYSFSGDWAKKETQATSYLTLSALTAGGSASPMENSVDTGRTVWLDISYSAPITVAANGAIWKATYTVDKDTPTGDYTVNLSVDGLTNSSYNADSGYTLTATISVTNTTPVATGYTVTASASEANVETGDSVAVYLDVTNSDIVSFNAVDMTLTYDPDQFTYTSGNTVSGFTVVDSTSGSLRIQGYGAPVTIGAGHEFTLEFTANATGTGSFALNTAKVDTAANANENISAATVTGSTATVTVNAPVVTYSVNFVSGSTFATGIAPAIAAQAKGAKFNLPANDFTWDNHVFVGWKYDDTVYEAGDVFTMPGNPVTFTAQWRELTPQVSVETSIAYLSSYTLIKVSGVAAGKVAKYDGNAMYKLTGFSGSKYNSNAFYYITETTSFNKDNITYADGTATPLNKSADVNQTGLIDINDAQFVYNIYNGTAPTTNIVARLLLADVNNDGKIDSLDCAAAVAAID